MRSAAVRESSMHALAVEHSFVRAMSGYGMQTRLLHLHEAEPLTQSASSSQV
jgi:hypothetical protein